MIRKAENVIDLIGSTPLIRLSNLEGDGSAEIYAKLESANPGGSVKDRIAMSMVQDAEERGALQPGGTIIEPTSGNTGIGLALVGAVRGYRVVLVMPESMSMERRKLLAVYGAELVLTPAELGMRGAVEKAEKLLAENPKYFLPDQFGNPANPEIHRRTTAVEILKGMAGKEVHAFVSGVGTGGTITGVGEVLKGKFSDVRLVAVEPARSPVLSGGKPGPHKIQGIGAGFVPRVLNTKIMDEIITVTDEDAYKYAQLLAKKEGLHMGWSAGAAACAALAVAKRLGKGKNVVTVLPDTGERYLSMGEFSV